MKFKRIFLLVLDSLGVGEARDANMYHDEGANTLKAIRENYDLYIPNFEKLGLLNTLTLNDEDKECDAYYTIARPNNAGKDSLSGHYEILGMPLKEAYKSFDKQGFSADLIQNIEALSGLRIIGNKSASPDAILEEYGKSAATYGSVIIYAGEDSTLQLSAHEDVIPLKNQLLLAQKIRKLTDLNPMWRVSRVIVRPFTGKEKLRFTSDRVDLAIDPPLPNLLTRLKDKNLDVISIGKISDLVNGEGITKIVKAGKKNSVAVNKLTAIMEKDFNGLCMVNFDDFDNFGHARDVASYGSALEELDVEVPMILNRLKPDDLLIITADHGADPMKEGKNHTRENVPLLIYSRIFKENKRLDISESLADIAATIADNFEVDMPSIGNSLLDKLN